MARALQREPRFRLAPRWAALALGLALGLVSLSSVPAQDILRRQIQLDSLANIQLPPQLASLTPEQIRQLAQLRELQIQQQQQQQGAPLQTSGEQQRLAAPQPTSRPVAQVGAQIPQPMTVSGAAKEPANDKHDDGSYNEAGTELEGAEPGAEAAATLGAAGGPAPSQRPSSAEPSFEVNWNKCPQLEPQESEKSKKTLVITSCLQAAPTPGNLSRENVEAHREQIATCALKAEGWFDEAGNYRYAKAEQEIRAKRLEPAIELQVLKFHVACQDEAAKKFPSQQSRLIDQVQFYQACMDYYISIVCEIEVSVDQ